MNPVLRQGTALLATLLATSPAANAWAQACTPAATDNRPTIGLALGGGGARGYAHVGVLRMLEEMRIPYDYVAGTSMGSIVGALTATGMDSQEIIDVIEGADWSDLFSDLTPREDQPARRKGDDVLGLYGPKLGVGEGSTVLPTGLVAGQKILFLFESVTSQRTQVSHFNDLPIPFQAVATDIISGEMVVLDQGSLSQAMRASMAVPGAFDPVRRGEALLVDGGLVRNLPVDVVRDMGADIVIAIDVGTPLLEADDVRNVLNIVEQMSSLLVVQNTLEQEATLHDTDILIRPDIDVEITSVDFTRFTEAWPLGYEAARSVQDQLATLSLSESDYRDWRQSVENCVHGLPAVEFVRLDNQSRFSDGVIKDMLSIMPGEPLDVARLDQDLRLIYGLGFIRLATYRVVEEDGQTGVVITVQQDERGTDFIETGLTLSGSGRGMRINLQAGYLKTDLDDRGSEFRVVGQAGDDFGVLVDVYKFLDDRQRWFVEPYLGFSRRDILAFNDTGRAEAVAEIDDVSIGFEVGREFNRHVLLSAGAVHYIGTADVTIGDPTLDHFHFTGGEWNLQAQYDRLDSLFLPTRGAAANIQYINSTEALGADTEFEQLRTSFLTSKSWGRHNFLLTGRYNTTLSGESPVYALFTGGGFLNMSGFEPTELVGQHFGFVGAGYRFQVTGSGGFLPGYAGMTVEYGNAADNRSDIFGEGVLNGSVYFAYGTPLGPLYLGYGYNFDRSGVFFLRLGSVIAGDSIGRR